MNKFFSKMSTTIVIVLFFITAVPITVYATPVVPTTVSKTYSDNGNYYETTITYHTMKSGIRGASKTTTFKNSSGKALWYVKVTADFTFNGSTSACTSVSVSADSYSSSWKIVNKSSSKSGNRATATAKAAQYFEGVQAGTKTQTVNLYCDKNGNLS